MDKLKMHTPDMPEDNISRLMAIFPHCVKESKDAEGNLRRAVDFEILKQELSEYIIEGPQERYQMNWPGKREAQLTANAPIAKTLRPAREESVNFGTTQNLFIEGDNLDALKLLQETYLGKVKMIYIDPPYNTGNDFVYEDDFAENAEDYFLKSNQIDEFGNRLVANTDSNGRFHSDWLSMLYPRLRLARNLLAEDGVIFISIDDHEVHNLRKICDEIFGEQNFATEFIWQKRVTRENRRLISVVHEYVVCYLKDVNSANDAISILPMNDEAISRYLNPDNDSRGVWTSVPAIAQAGHGTKNQFYSFLTPSGREVAPPSGSCWRYTKAKMMAEIDNNNIWFGSDGNGVPRIKKFLTDGKQGLTPNSLLFGKDIGTTDSAKRELTNLFDGISVFETPKPTSLLVHLIEIGARDGDIVIDFFAGTSTAAHAVMQLNARDGGSRKFIMVQMPEICAEDSEAFKIGLFSIAEIGKERIRRAGKRIIEELGIAKGNIDVGFRVLKIDTSNMGEVYYKPDVLKQGDIFDLAENIRTDRTAEDLLFQVLLDWGVNLMLPISNEIIQGHEVFFVDGNALAACFVKNGEVNEEFCTELAKRQPLRVVFRDAGFKSDDVKINVEQIFKLMSPHTEVKTI